MSSQVYGAIVTGLIFGVILFLSGIRTMKRKKLMQSLPTSKIRSLAIGISEIHGKVIPTDRGTITSPFSGEKCVCARIIIEESSRMSKYHRWHVVKKLVWGNNFYLEDETGKVLVDIADADLDIPITYVFHSGIGNRPPPHIEAFLKANGMNHEGFLGINRSLRYTELIIRPNDDLYVLGRADINPHLSEGTAEHSVENLMMHRSRHPNIYYISNLSEKQIMGKINSKIIGKILGGALIIGGCLFLISLNLLNFR